MSPLHKASGSLVLSMASPLLVGFMHNPADAPVHLVVVVGGNGIYLLGMCPIGTLLSGLLAATVVELRGPGGVRLGFALRLEPSGPVLATVTPLLIPQCRAPGIEELGTEPMLPLCQGFLTRWNVHCRHVIT